MEKRGEFTAERLIERRPAIYRSIVEGYAQGLSVRQLCRAYRVSHHTVSAVVEREPNAIATYKEEFIASCRKFQRLSIDRLNDEVYEIPIQTVAVAFGIVSDKLSIAQGGATSRIEHTQSGPTHEDYLRMIQGKVIEAEVIATGFQGEEAPQKEADPVAAVQAEPFEVSAPAAESGLVLALPAAGVIPTGSPENMTAPDEQSGVSDGSDSVADGIATHLDTLSTLPNDSGDASPVVQEPGQSVEIVESVNDATTTTGERKRASRTRTEGGRGASKSRRVSGGH